MGNDSKRDVPVTTKEQEHKKGGALRALAPFEDTERMFQQFMTDWLRPLAWDRPLWRGMMEPFQGRMPRTDVIDREEGYLVRVEVPGVDKKDIEVSLADNMLRKGAERGLLPLRNLAGCVLAHGPGPRHGRCLQGRGVPEGRRA